MKVVVVSRAGEAHVTCESDEKVLFAGLRAGLTLPYDCATGTCGMCRARVIEGQVEVVWADAPALAKLQRDKGDILMCQTRAVSDCTLRVPGHVVATSGHVPKDWTGRVQNKRRLTDDVMHFELALDEPMAFDAGQFVVLTAPGMEGARAYSMVNHAAGGSVLEFVIKKKHGGGLSEWLFSTDRTGVTLGVFGPLGRATFRPKEDGDFVAIAGGSGIAGVLSILEQAVASGHFTRHKAQVFFGVRTLADGFYLDRFARLIAGAKGALEVVLAVSHETRVAESHPTFEAIRVAQGFVHEVADQVTRADLAGVTAFVAGPPPMVDGAIRVLIGHGVASPAIRYDKFG